MAGNIKAYFDVIISSQDDKLKDDSVLEGRW
jgi:hypothetical protein